LKRKLITGSPLKGHDKKVKCCPALNDYKMGSHMFY